MKASDIMTLGAATVRRDASLLKAIETMLNHRISALPVLDEKGALCGILTEGDVVRATEFLPVGIFDMPDAARKKALSGAAVGKYMTVGAITVDRDADVGDAVAIMKERALKRLPVVSEGKVVGLLSRADILNTLVA
jgi:CBS domain-containing protein